DPMELHLPLLRHTARAARTRSIRPVPQMIRADYCVATFSALQLFMQAYPPAPFVNSEIRGYSRTAATRLPDALRGRARRSARPRPRPAAAVRADLGPVPAHRHVTPHPRAV